MKPIIDCAYISKVCFVGNGAFQLDIYFLEATRTSNFRVYSFQGNIKLYAKYINAIFDDHFYRRYILKISKNLWRL